MFFKKSKIKSANSLKIITSTISLQLWNSNLASNSSLSDLSCPVDTNGPNCF